MLFGRLRVLSLLFPVVLTGCTSPDVTTRVERAGAAVPSYAPPSGAPAFCSALAGTTHLTDLSAAVGTLVADPGDVKAGLTLTAAAAELQDVLDHVGDRPAIRTSLRDLVATLRRAQGGPITGGIRRAIATELDDVGRRAQNVCDFPA